jgi:hypothetical protein
LTGSLGRSTDDAGGSLAASRALCSTVRRLAISRFAAMLRAEGRAQPLERRLAALGWDANAARARTARCRGEAV